MFRESCRRSTFRLLWILTALLWGAVRTADAGLVLGKDDLELRLTEGLSISEVSSWGRRTVNPDAVALAMVRGTFAIPKEGDRLARPEAMGGGESAWKPIRASGEGEFEVLPRGSAIACVVASESRRVMLLEVAGNTMVYVNGEPHAGDPYSFGYVRIPVQLTEGDNQFVIVHAGRGPLRARLAAPKSEVVANVSDLTLPSVLSEDPQEYLLGIPLSNATDHSQSVSVRVRGPNAIDGGVTDQFDLPPLSVQKVPVRARLRRSAGAGDIPAEILVERIGTPDHKGAELSRSAITLHGKSPDQPHSRTFLSNIDASAQYVAVTPQAREGATEHPGLVISLHGASVEATSQAPCYSLKPDFVVVCPTNRRPYGFDWEEWGRLDAMEALDRGREWFGTDRRKQYLTGHSMGGHGTWQVGEIEADSFAAMAPSAGWISFDTYANQRAEATEKSESPMLAMLRRATSASETLALMPNLKGKGIYVLHGDADDNVPPSEGRLARETLARLGIEFGFHEEPGAGHWWSWKPGHEAPGTACVDWPDFFSMFRSRALPAPGEQTEFQQRMLQPGVALLPGEGLTILRAQRPGLLAQAEVRLDRGPSGDGRASIATSNVCMLSLGERVIGDAPLLEIEVDGQSVRAARRGTHIGLFRDLAGKWRDAGSADATGASSMTDWNPARGPFKNAFTNRFVLVYGTHGSATENAWSLARARFDAEQWWYRGNGRAPMLSDQAFLTLLDRGAVDFNAVVYGNSDTNSAAERLTQGQAVRCNRRELVVGTRRVREDDVGVLAVGTFKGAPGSRPLVYGLVSGTGVVGLRATDRIPCIVSGTGIPDVLAVRADFWSRAERGIVCAGFLDQNFDADRSEILWFDESRDGPENHDRP